MRVSKSRFAVRAALVLSTIVCSRPGAAQRPAGADTLSAKAVTESLAVLDRLDAQIKREPGNAALWYRRGMIAWALYDRDRVTNGAQGVDWTRIGRLADTSLRIARSLEPNNPRYVLSAGQYFLGTGLLTMRVQSAAMFGSALDMTRESGNTALHAESALEVGRVYWRRYDAVANAGFTTADAAEVRMLAQALAKDSAVRTKTADPERASKTRPYTRRTISSARRTLDKTSQQPADGFPGENDYLKAEDYIQEAYEAFPAYNRAYKQLCMLLAERARWTELEALSRDNLAREPADAWSWMTLGLATYRAGDTRTARESFDKGLQLLSAGERKRLNHLERVLRPADTTESVDWPPNERADNERRYWMAADPLWSIPDIDARTEFLARVTFADLRWTVEELSTRGADTDRGAVYVRYGPPDRIAAKDGASTWSYDFRDLKFKFVGAPTFGTARFSDTRSYAVMDTLPAVWDNTHLLQIDSIFVQPVRFRASTVDSVDVLFAAVPPIDAVRKASDVTGPVRRDLWVLDTAGVIIHHDSMFTKTSAMEQVSRAVPFGSFDYRLEVSSTGSLVAGRSSGTLVVNADRIDDGFRTRGFGISDFVVAQRAEPAGNGPHTRWRDYAITPFAGAIPRGAKVTLLWENYDFGNRNGSTDYQMSVSIVRERSRAGRIAAQLVGVVSKAVRRDATVDRVNMQYDRTGAAAPVTVENIGVDLGTTPPGTYTITLEITDRVSGSTVKRSSRIVIAE